MIESSDQWRRVTPLSCEFAVLGVPRPGGSKTSYPFTDANGKMRSRVVDANQKTVEPWKEEIRKAAKQTMGERPPFEGPLLLVVWFYLPRPRSHYLVSGLKIKAPRYPVVRPDTTKLLRPLEDALTGLLWKDDSQIVEQIVRKRYGDEPKAHVRVSVMR